MELWIVNQRKDKIVKTDHIFKTNQEIYFLKGDTSYILGHYENKERTEEVFKEIIDILKPHMMIKSFEQVVTQEKSDLKYVVNPQYEEVKELSTVVYEMPEK